MKRRWALATLLALAGAAASGGAELRAGAAKVPITPQGSIWLAGRNRASAGVAGEIYARALALDDGAGGRAVFIATDLAGLPRSLTERVAVDLMKAHELDRSQILFNASGARGVPPLKGWRPELEPTDPVERRKVEQYSETLVRYLGDAAGAALGDLKPARLDFGMGRVPSAEDATETVELPVLRVSTPKGGLIAVLFGSATSDATHCDSTDAINGGPAGEAEAAIEKGFPGTIALFYRLCGPGAREPGGAALAAAVTRLMKSPMTPVQGRLQSALIETALPLSVAAGHPEEARNAMRQAPFAVQVVRFQRGFALLALGVEAAPDSVQKIRQALREREIVVASCPGEGAAVAIGEEAEERVLDAAGRAWKRAGKR